MITIKNGIITSDKINIIQHLIPSSNKEAWGYPMTPIYITIHNTGNPNVSAKNNSIYVDKNNGYISWHFTIGSNEIYQELPITISSWHSGDGANGTGNRKSIGIEIAEVDGAEEMAIKFVAELLIALNMNIDKVVPHQKWSGKYCPRLILPHWDKFIEDIRNEMNKMDINSAKQILKTKANLDDNTMQYLEYYRYGEDLIKKLASGMSSVVEVPKVEVPIDKTTYTVTPNGTHQLCNKPLNLKFKEENKSNTKLDIKNGVNSSFFWNLANGLKYSTSILYANDKIYQNNANHLPSPQSVFIIYKSGLVEMKRLLNLNGLDLSKIHLAVGGVGLLSDDANFKYNPALDGFSGAYADVLRKTAKTVIGYNKKEDSVYLLCRDNIVHSSSLSYDLLELVKDCDYSIAMSIDGGGSSCMYSDGKNVFKGDGRVIHGSLYFNK